VTEAAQGPVALALGRESSGLSNEELAHCHYLTQIPANPAFSSLNLASAAQVFAYEIRQTWLATYAAEQSPLSVASPHQPAGADEMASFFEHLRTTLIRVGFAKPEQSYKLLGVEP
jgi:tRNA (cytidine32/uridine32-2'-O)-methyltransferase